MISQLLCAQRAYFQSGVTLPVSFRLAMLKRLQTAIERHQPEISAALKQDLGKSEFEGYMCEIGMTLSEIRYFLHHLRGFVKPKRVATPLAQFPAVSYMQSVPFGNTLIMSPWNYPFLLTMEPLVDAIAAGNTAIVKPSAYSPATSAVIADLIADCFPPEYVTVVTGGRKENQTLLEQRFDFVFFTGSQTVGKEVLRHTAETLTPVVLELGGKSPCIVDETANIALAAKRIVFGKFLNCGQTCVAPDYILCQKTAVQSLITAIMREITAQFGDAPLENPNYGHIVSEKHFRRLLALIDQPKVVCGGEYNETTRQIAPTVLCGVTATDAVMQEEIFGPILPILTYETEQDCIDFIQSREKPLALYLFTQDKQRVKTFTLRVPFGGGCVNDTIIHLATSRLPFGGVGESGMGSYHGKAGFEAFSHRKSLVRKATWLDIPLRYQPYRQNGVRTLRRFMK